MRNFVMLLAVVAIASPAVAKEKERKGGDPNRVICRVSDIVGTRLQTKRTCMTAQQWEALHQDQRNTIERIQAFKPALGG